MRQEKCFESRKAIAGQMMKESLSLNLATSLITTMFFRAESTWYRVVKAWNERKGSNGRACLVREGSKNLTSVGECAGFKLNYSETSIE